MKILPFCYQEFLMEPKTREQGAALCRVLFKRKLVCGDPKIRQVVVCHYALGEERGLSLPGGSGVCGSVQ